MAVTGGDKLARKLAEIAAKVKGLPHVEVGFPETARYEDGTLVAMVAAIQEFGAPAAGIPPRPFFRTMIAKHRDAWGPGLGGILAANGMDVEAGLKGLGQVIEGQLRQSIVDMNSPALSPTTLMLRRMRTDDPSLQVTGKTVGEAAAKVKAGASYAGVSTKPLVDIGRQGGTLLNSISSKTVMP